MRRANRGAEERIRRHSKKFIAHNPLDRESLTTAQRRRIDINLKKYIQERMSKG